MISFIKQFFKIGARTDTDDPAIWSLAEALLWRDEDVSMGAIPSPIKEQPEAKRYYNDAVYLINWMDRYYKGRELHEKAKEIGLIN